MSLWVMRSAPATAKFTPPAIRQRTSTALAVTAIRAPPQLLPAEDDLAGAHRQPTAAVHLADELDLGRRDKDLCPAIDPGRLGGEPHRAAGGFGRHRRRPVDAAMEFDAFRRPHPEDTFPVHAVGNDHHLRAEFGRVHHRSPGHTTDLQHADLARQRDRVQVDGIRQDVLTVRVIQSDDPIRRFRDGFHRRRRGDGHARRRCHFRPARRDEQPGRRSHFEPRRRVLFRERRGRSRRQFNGRLRFVGDGPQDVDGHPRPDRQQDRQREQQHPHAARSRSFWHRSDDGRHPHCWSRCQQNVGRRFPAAERTRAVDVFRRAGHPATGARNQGHGQPRGREAVARDGVGGSLPLGGFVRNGHRPSNGRFE